jgi:dihydroxy-acid dehydratase
VDPAELKERQKSWKQPKPKFTGGVLARYMNSVTSASEGGVLR